MPVNVKAKRSRNPERDKRIADMYLDGWPVRTVAAHFGLGEVRVYAILRQQGLQLRDVLERQA